LLVGGVAGVLAAAVVVVALGGEADGAVVDDAGAVVGVPGAPAAGAPGTVVEVVVVVSSPGLGRLVPSHWTPSSGA
jgi:hypothetical protein